MFVSVCFMNVTYLYVTCIELNDTRKYIKFNGNRRDKMTMNETI